MLAVLKDFDQLDDLRLVSYYKYHGRSAKSVSDSS